MVHQLNCPEACGLFPDQGPVSPALASRFLTTGPPGKSLNNLLIINSYTCTEHYSCRISFTYLGHFISPYSMYQQSDVIKHHLCTCGPLGNMKKYKHTTEVLNHIANQNHLGSLKKKTKTDVKTSRGAAWESAF